MKVKDITSSSVKFAKRGMAAGPEYITGVKNPKVPWQGATLAAEANYDAGVMAGIARKAFADGVGGTSDAKWMDKAVKKGGRNFPTAVGEAGPDYAVGVAPYFAALGALTLTPRGPRGSPGNYDRVKQVGDALNKVRTG